MKFVLRHAYATPAFTFVRAHECVDLLSPVEQAFIKLLQSDTLSRGELRLHYFPTKSFVVEKKI